MSSWSISPDQNSLLICGGYLEDVPITDEITAKVLQDKHRDMIFWKFGFYEYWFNFSKFSVLVKL